MKTISVVVTGASGFLGQHILDRLKFEKNINVIPVSRIDRCSFFRSNDYRDIPQGEILIHLAEDNLTVSEKVEKQCENSLSLMSNYLSNYNFKLIIYISSAAVYGDLQSYPHSTRDQLNPTSPYAKRKIEVENLLLQSNKGVIVRIVNTYGYHMSKSNVISSIINQLYSKGPIILQSCNPVRDFIAVEDVANGVVSILLHYSESSNLQSIYNLGTGIGTSIEKLVKEVLKISLQTNREIHEIIESKNSSIIIVDYSDAFEDFGWMPKIDLRFGLESLLAGRQSELL